MKIPRVHLPATWQCSVPVKEPTTLRDRRAGWRIIVLVLVLVPGMLLIRNGRDVPTVVMAVAGLGLAGPTIGSLLARAPGGAA
jgi:hypothetical protein